MIKTLPAALLIAVAACTPTSSVRQRPAIVSAVATKDPDDVAGCIALAWGKTPNFRVRTETAPGTRSVILSGSSVGGIDMVADVSDDRRVTMHARAAGWGAMGDRLSAAVRDCL